LKNKQYFYGRQQFLNTTHAATAQFALAAIRRWWEQSERARYPQARHLLIEADAGGCNGHRPRLWKFALQQIANDTGQQMTTVNIRRRRLCPNLNYTIRPSKSGSS